ncbi:MAG: hypothetical protein SFV52_10300 [Saprospiraceae bacterium]|nr:hypothetical protein [Saprospiraceae bacterium]
MQASEALQLVVQQIRGILSQLSADDYQKALPEYRGSTVGQHFRHILEFFHCLEQGLTAGRVDYAARRRNPLFETSPGLASDAFLAFACLLEGLPSEEQTVEVYAELGTDHRPCYGSTLGRELVFVYDHAIHHLAIIRIGLQAHFPEVATDEHLGVSPSTIKARLGQSN